MSKRFKAKKRRKLKTHILWYLFFILILFIAFIMLLDRFKLATTNQEFISKLLEDSNYHLKYNKTSFKVITDISSFLSNFKIKEPITILENTFQYTYKESDKVEMKEQKKEKNSLVPMVLVKNDVEDLKEPESSKVYIYNTHYNEGYASKNLEDYNITPNVSMAAHLLKEKLDKLGVATIVEEGDIGNFMAIHNLNHVHSYEASRYFVEDAIKNNPNLELIIDLHRDALAKHLSTVTIEGTDYAKILFVCGKENKNYQSNLDLMNKINGKIKEKYPTLTRGVITKEGARVNGIYNQDLSPKMILLECGGNENNIGEITNTITLIAPIIAEVLNEA